MMRRRYTVKRLSDRCFVIQEWRFIRSHRGHKCTAHWKLWLSPVVAIYSRTIARRVAECLNKREQFKSTFAMWGVQ